MIKMEKLQQLQNKLKDKPLLIYDVNLIEYFINLKFEVGERFIALYIDKTSVILILNRLFEIIDTKNVQTMYYFDGEDYSLMIKKLLTKHQILIDTSMPYRFVLTFLKQGFDLFDGSELINDLIAIKSEAEVLLMQQASSLNDKVMDEVYHFLKEGVSELEVYHFIIEKFKEYQADIAFKPIVAFGENCADPHAFASDRRLRKKDTIIIDMGCILNGYCSDMTRSFIYDNVEFEHIYDIVLNASKLAKAKIKAGVKLKELDKVARDYIKACGYGAYFNHRLGHGCGQIVHEPYDVAFNTEKVIEENMIFSIEPGIYLKEKGGIRIEDLVVAKKDGYLSLNNYPYHKHLKF